MSKVIGLLRVKDEKMLIKEQIEHLASLCDEVYVYDDGSEDGTLEIVQNHPRVNGVFANPGSKPSIFPRKDKIRIAWKIKRLLDFARRNANATEKDWFIYTDIDEQFEPGFKKALRKIVSQDKYDMVLCECYEFYLTDKDKDLPYNGNLQSMRKYCGTEYRVLPFVFRNLPNIFFVERAREPFGFDRKRIWYSPYKVKHFGKAKGVEAYLRKQKWYQKYRKQNLQSGFKYTKPPVHKVNEGKSDLGKLVSWEELKAHPEIKGPKFYDYVMLPWGNKHKFTYFLATYLIKLKGLIGKLILYKHWKKFLRR